MFRKLWGVGGDWCGWTRVWAEVGTDTRGLSGWQARSHKGPEYQAGAQLGPGNSGSQGCPSG
jgi:hypothetical protein